MRTLLVLVTALGLITACASDKKDKSNKTKTTAKDGDKSGAKPDKTAAKPDKPVTAPKPAADKPAADKPAADKPAADKPAKMPKQAAVKQGGTAWAVYLAVDKPGAKTLTAASASAKKLGYTVFGADINCTRPVDKGAPKAKGEQQIVAVYFDSKAKAELVAKAYGKSVWVGRAKTFCLD